MPMSHQECFLFVVTPARIFFSQGKRSGIGKRFACLSMRQCINISIFPAMCCPDFFTSKKRLQLMPWWIEKSSKQHVPDERWVLVLIYCSVLCFLCVLSATIHRYWFRINMSMDRTFQDILKSSHKSFQHPLRKYLVFFHFCFYTLNQFFLNLFMHCFLSTNHFAFTGALPARSSSSALSA